VVLENIKRLRTAKQATRGAARRPRSCRRRHVVHADHRRGVPADRLRRRRHRPALHAVTASLLVSLTVVPVLTYWFLAHSGLAKAPGLAVDRGADARGDHDDPQGGVTLVEVDALDLEIPAARALQRQRAKGRDAPRHVYPRWARRSSRPAVRAWSRRRARHPGRRRNTAAESR
jgi:hypothetical protein